jgi:transposase
MVAYRFEDSKGADCVVRHLAGFSGVLQVDGYSAYTSLAKTRVKAGSNETIQLAGCWAHLRLNFTTFTSAVYRKLRRTRSTQ